MSNYAWDVENNVSAIALDHNEVESVFDKNTLIAASSGWVCTLTIECGTFVCACH